MDLLKLVQASSSSGDARRLIEQGAVSLDGLKISDTKMQVSVKSGSLLRAGKKKYVRLLKASSGINKKT